MTKHASSVEGRLPSASLRKAMLDRDGYRCRKCGFHSPTGNVLEPHHVIPFDKGGPTTLDNLHTLCGPCHAELSWMWVNELPVSYERWLEIVPAASLLHLLLVAADETVVPFTTGESARRILGLDLAVVKRLLRWRK